MQIELQTIQSLFIEMRVNDQPLSVGTGFVVSRGGSHYLVSNRHNLAGRRSDNNELMSPTGAVPDVVRVWHNAAADLGQWISVGWSLYDESRRPRWFEHPVHGRLVDVVVLPLAETYPGTLYRPYDLDAQPAGLSTRVTTDVQVIGFPFGVTGGGFLGIWTRGTIASEWEVDFNNLPSFLIDARTRQGQSGSPVLIHNTNGMSTMADGGVSIGGPATQLLGVYSGRINEQSDLGIVWKIAAIISVIDGRARPQSN